MFYIFYNLISILLLIPVVVYHYYRSASRGRKAAFAERFGIVPSDVRLKCAGKKTIWVHAVSVGEAIASRPLLKSLRNRYPEYLLIVSTTTETGRGVAEKFSEPDSVFYFPFDFLPAVTSALNAIKPAMIIIMETEIWPNFNREAARRKIPLFLANGRISDRSFSRYMTFSWFFRHPLTYFSALCMQTATDRDRIMAIGAPAERTFVVGNLKYDLAVTPPDAERKQKLREQYAVPEAAIVIIAASTHAGEEQYLIESYKKLLGLLDQLFLVLVPRHPERADDVENLLRDAALPCKRRSALSIESSFTAGEVLLVDTIGEMMALYELSDVAFVGGSLVPTGGHNLLEPASVGVASIFGPYTTNFREITGLVLQYGAGVEVASPSDLYESLKTLVCSAELRLVLGKNGLKLMRDNGGSAGRHLEQIAACI